jgi:hypothetical protein
MEGTVIMMEESYNMGLDQYAGFRDSDGNVQEEFYWRKHARLQQFMAKEFNEQNKTTKHNTLNDLQHLGFNGGQGGVKITKELVERLEEAFKNKYYDYFASDGFFWGQQFQEEKVTEYKEQDKNFIDWCKEQLDAGKDINYDCSW